METLPRAGAGAVANGDGGAPVVVLGILLGALFAALTVWAFSNFESKVRSRRQ